MLAQRQPGVGSAQRCPTGDWEVLSLRGTLRQLIKHIQLELLFHLIQDHRSTEDSLQSQGVRLAVTLRGRRWLTSNAALLS